MVIYTPERQGGTQLCSDICISDLSCSIYFVNTITTTTVITTTTTLVIHI
jgi:hypothetical protein